MDFSAQLARQLRYLERSCRDYDAGDREEGVRLAGPLAVLFHDTPKSISLLRHLGKKGIRLRSTCRRYPKRWGYWPLPNLVSIRLCPPVNLFECVPKLGNAGGGRSLLFQQWWDEVIYRRGSERVSRRALVLDARNTDGVGHAAAQYAVRYRAMVDGADWKLLHRPDGGPEVTLPLRDVHVAALRQIAFEVLNSPELTALAPGYRPAPAPEKAVRVEESDGSALGLKVALINFGEPSV